MQQADQANVEYWFRQIYDLFFGAHSLTGLAAWAASWWGLITWLGYIAAVLGLGVIVYTTVRLFELRRREGEYYGTLILAPESERENPRWAHIESLMQSGNQSDWRQAIIEADILLGDMLTRQGYRGASIGDQLKQVEPADFDTLDSAWTAHRVRNDIAHSGSAFDLSQVLAQRTIGQYQAVFREFGIV